MSSVNQGSRRSSSRSVVASSAVSDSVSQFQSSQKSKYGKSFAVNSFQQQQQQQQQQHAQQQQSSQLLNAFKQSKVLYENQIPMRLIEKEKEDQLTYLTLKIVLQPGNSTHGQALQMEITDECNQLFLYTLQLNEIEFLAVKNEQTLLVDFNGFTAKLAELMELALNSHKDDKIQFVCVLEKRGEDAFLLVTELNQFKSIVHLTLQFLSASDAKLAQYLGEKVAIQIVDNEELRIQSLKLEESLQESESKATALKMSLRDLQVEYENEKEQVNLNQQKVIHLQREEFFQRESDLRDDLEKQNLVKEDILKEQLAQQQAANQARQKSLSEVQESKYELESSVRELTSRLRIAEKENQSAVNEMQSLRIDNKRLDEIKFDQEKKITELSLKLYSSQKSLDDKQQLIASTLALNAAVEGQKRVIEREVNEKAQTITRLERQLEKCRKEVEKANEIAEVLRESLFAKKQKIDCKKAIISQLEVELVDLRTAAEKEAKELSVAVRERDQLKVQFAEANIQVTDIKAKLVDSQNLIEQNQAMIQYLNNQLNVSRPPLMVNNNSSLKSGSSMRVNTTAVAYSQPSLTGSLAPTVEAARGNGVNMLIPQKTLMTRAAFETNRLSHLSRSGNLDGKSLSQRQIRNELSSEYAKTLFSLQGEKYEQNVESTTIIPVKYRHPTRKSETDVPADNSYY